MGNTSLKVKIGNRVYPLSINESDVDKARQAEKLVNENIEKLKKDFGLNDPVDLLAMTAFEFANNSFGNATPVSHTSEVPEEVQKKLQEIHQRIEELTTLE